MYIKAHRLHVYIPLIEEQQYSARLDGEWS